MTRNATTRFAVLLGSIALVLGALSAPAAQAAQVASPSSARAGGADAPVQHQGKDVVYFDLYYTPEVAPRRVFFYASSGPYLRGMQWKGWGTDKTVGRGHYISTCASCAPPKRRKAVVRFSGLKYCAKQDLYYYKRATMTRKPSEGQTRTVKISAGSCGSHH